MISIVYALSYQWISIKWNYTVTDFNHLHVCPPFYKLSYMEDLCTLRQREQITTHSDAERSLKLDIYDKNNLQIN